VAWQQAACTDRLRALRIQPTPIIIKQGYVVEIEADRGLTIFAHSSSPIFFSFQATDKKIMAKIMQTPYLNFIFFLLEVQINWVIKVFDFGSEL
jgi:hypothetical protein